MGRLGVLGGPSLRLGRDTYKPTDLLSFLSSCLGALRASWELLQPLLPPVVEEMSEGGG